MSADQKAFLGRWNLTGTGAHTDRVYWLEVKDEGGKLSGMFLNRGGSPLPLESVKVEGDQLIFQIAARPNVPAIEHRAKLERGKLVGSTTDRGTAIQWVGVRPPTWPPADANAKHSFGKPIELFDGKSLDTFDLQHKDRPSGWTVVDGAMTNEAKANNLISKQKFKDYKIQAEYKLEKDSNSGIYQRGRYELQVVDDFGKPAESHGHMSIYAWVAPSVNASKPAGEWQAMEAIVVGNKVTVTLERSEGAGQLDDPGDHGWRAGCERDGAGPDHAAGRSRQGVVPQGDGDADHRRGFLETRSTSLTWAGSRRWSRSVHAAADTGRFVASLARVLCATCAVFRVRFVGSLVRLLHYGGRLP